MQQALESIFKIFFTLLGQKKITVTHAIISVKHLLSLGPQYVWSYKALNKSKLYLCKRKLFCL